MTKLEICRNDMGSLVCDRKKGHKGNHKYRYIEWTQDGEYLGRPFVK